MTNLERLARTIAGLYNNSLVAPAAVMHGTAGPAKMTPERAKTLARAVVELNGYNFDYVDGRLIKVRISPTGEVSDFRLYDRDNGAGAGAWAVEEGLTDPLYGEVV